MLRALQLEWRYGKDEILAIYLTVAPFGGNLEGVKAASPLLFRQAAETPDAGRGGIAGRFAAVPRERAAGPQPAPRPASARDKILERMARDGVLSADAADAARTETIPNARYAARMAAPHLARRLAG